MRAAVALVLGLFLLAVPARADLVMANGDGKRELRLYETPCTHAGTIGHIKAKFPEAQAEHVARFRNARILDRRGTIEAYGCWLESDDGAAFIMYEDGSNTEYQLSSFKNPTI